VFKAYILRAINSDLPDQGQAKIWKNLRRGWFFPHLCLDGKRKGPSKNGHPSLKIARWKIVDHFHGKLMENSCFLLFLHVFLVFQHAFVHRFLITEINVRVSYHRCCKSHLGGAGKWNLDGFQM